MVCIHAVRVEQRGFKLKIDTHEVIILVYVNDIVILGPEPNGVNWAKEVLKSLFKFTDFGKLEYYLGVSLKRIGNMMLQLQSAYSSRTPKEVLDGDGNDRIDHDGREYQGAVYGTGVE